MLDFLEIRAQPIKRGHTEIKPEFLIVDSEDLMIKGGDFYAVWVEERGLWSTKEQDLTNMVDRELRKHADEFAERFPEEILHVRYMRYSSSGSIDKWHKYVKQQKRDSFHPLDGKLVFQNDEVNKKDYASMRMKYPLEAGDCSAWNRLTSVLYSPEEREKIEWAIGAIISGQSQKIQKFMVIYGGPGTGKSTILNIIQMIFEDHYCVFDAKALGSSNAQFAVEAFRSNPLVAIQQDGDLSKIEDNTRLNSIVSHDEMLVNEKNTKQYPAKFRCFLFMGTNKPVRITDAKSGLIRRLIDVAPTGEKLKKAEYDQVMSQVEFELGAIAKKCLDFFLENPGRYDDYIPIAMLGASNDFYNFVSDMDNYTVFEKEDGTTLKAAWEMYQAYCNMAKVRFPMDYRPFKEELKNYFKDFKERATLENGMRIRNWYSGFLKDKFIREEISDKSAAKPPGESSCWLKLTDHISLFDILAKDYPAQYANEEGIPKKKWTNVDTTLKDLDTSQLHYVKVPETHIVIDFDIPDENGNKCLEKNLEAVSRWPPTYGELSKSGQGIHLHYIYKGDPSKLSRIYDDRIEIKVFTGNMTLRRKLTRCNSLPIAEISSGLPLKGEDKLVNKGAVKNEKAIRTLIKRSINKEYHPGTKPSIDFIKKILDDAYDSGVKYDVSDMFNAVLVFATNSTHNSDYCTKLVSQMKFKSEEDAPPGIDKNEYKDGYNINKDILIFFDVEVFINLFIVCYKAEGEGKAVIRMINPSPKEISELMRYKLVGFNCRQYDNHILYARMIGYSEEQLYHLSQSIINSEKGSRNRGMFGNAYNVSYTDILDFSSEKKSLKKFEIELGIHHQELGLPWDQPVPEDKWQLVADYCANDVLATEAVWNARQADFMARQIQVELVKALHGIDTATVNDTTNSLSERIIFGAEKNPQLEFNYRDLSKPVSWTEYTTYRKKFGPDYIFHIFDSNGLPTYEVYDGESCVALPDGYSILPFFPGYKYEFGKSTYMGEEIGEGGRVYAEPGIYENIWDGDIASQHPHSVIAECLFGPRFTKIFEEIVEARVAIKHKDFEKAGSFLNGVLKPWLTDEYAKGLAQALKIIINSIYGLTSAGFANRFRDDRNIDNIVAKRGALFMTLLKSEVQKRGYKVAHIKTDSIKIVGATNDIREFVTRFGREFGYEFETEAEFDKFCLVNDAVYVAKYKEAEDDIWWTATGTQFQIPYVFKTLFSGEELRFEDFCETKSVSKGAIVIDMNETLPQLAPEEEKEKKDILKLFDPEAKVSKEKLLMRYNLASIDDAKARLEEIQEKEDKSHNYIFVGRVGQFCPIVSGGDGGVLYRMDNGKYYAVAGTKGYRWLESEIVKTLDKQDLIDRSYYDELCEEAIKTIDTIGTRCGWGGYLRLVGKEGADDGFEWPPEVPKY